jgi:hypothetical protein
MKMAVPPNISSNLMGRQFADSSSTGASTGTRPRRGARRWERGCQRSTRQQTTKPFLNWRFDTYNCTHFCFLCFPVPTVITFDYLILITTRLVVTLIFKDQHPLWTWHVNNFRVQSSNPRLEYHNSNWSGMLSHEISERLVGCAKFENNLVDFMSVVGVKILAQFWFASSKNLRIDYSLLNYTVPCSLRP